MDVPYDARGGRPASWKREGKREPFLDVVVVEPEKILGKDLDTPTCTIYDKMKPKIGPNGSDFDHFRKNEFKLLYLVDVTMCISRLITNDVDVTMYISFYYVVVRFKGVVKKLRGSHELAEI